MESLSFVPRRADQIRLDPSDKNYYLVNGKKYVRVTHAMSKMPKPWLDKWRAKVGQEEASRIADETATDGSLIHKVTELRDRGQNDEARQTISNNPWVVIYDVAWRVWSKASIVRWYMIEQSLYHEGLQIAGTIDRLGLFIGDMCTTLVDVKSTKSLSDSMGIQLFLYKTMITDTVNRYDLDPRLIPQRAVIAHLPGPRYENGVNTTEFERVRVKEYFLEKYKEEALECIAEFWQLRK